MKIVGLVGPKRSGKDTAAAALLEQRGYTRIGFADALKDLALRINPLVGEYYDAGSLRGVVEGLGWERAKEHEGVRQFLQELGIGVRDLVGPGTWITAWQKQASLVPWDGGIVVPDVRFLNEAKRIRGYGVKHWLLVRIERPGLDTTDRHVSETEQAGIECDVTIVNDGTPEQLQAKVLAAVDERFE